MYKSVSHSFLEVPLLLLLLLRRLVMIRSCRGETESLCEFAHREMIDFLLPTEGGWVPHIVVMRM